MNKKEVYVCCICTHLLGAIEVVADREEGDTDAALGGEGGGAAGDNLANGDNFRVDTRAEGTPPVSRGRHVLDVGEPPAAAGRQLVLEAGDVGDAVAERRLGDGAVVVFRPRVRALPASGEQEENGGNGQRWEVAGWRHGGCVALDDEEDAWLRASMIYRER